MVRENSTKFNAGTIVITGTPRDRVRRVICPNCGEKCGHLEDRRDGVVEVVIEKFRLTVDSPVDIIKICNTDQNASANHKHHYAIRYLINNIGFGNHINAEPYFEPKRFSRSFDGPMHDVACTEISPCLCKPEDGGASKLNLLKTCCDLCKCSVDKNKKEIEKEQGVTPKTRLKCGTYNLADSRNLFIYPPVATGGIIETKRKRECEEGSTSISPAQDIKSKNTENVRNEDLATNVQEKLELPKSVILNPIAQCNVQPENVEQDPNFN